MKRHIVWDYTNGWYINYKGIAITFKTENDAEDLIKDIIEVDKVVDKPNKDDWEYRDNYLIEVQIK